MLVGVVDLHVGQFADLHVGQFADLHVGQSGNWVQDWNGSVAPKHLLVQDVFQFLHVGAFMQVIEVSKFGIIVEKDEWMDMKAA